MKKLLLIFLVFCVPGIVLSASGGHGNIEEVIVNLRDHYSIQRGAKIFMNYCQGCHSARYMRYNRFALDNHVTNRKGEVLEDVLKETLMFNTDKVGAPIETAMTAQDAKRWFGAPPPDLSLTVRQRGKDWVYTYMKSFYVDEIKPWGVNNVVFPDVGMPNVFQSLQGTQVPVYRTEIIEVDGRTQEKQVLDHLELAEPGSLTPKEYDRFVTDLVSFLAYVAEPMKMERQKIGVWVILFLLFFGAIAYFLKKEYWRDVH